MPRIDKTAPRRAALKKILIDRFEESYADMARAIQRDDAHVWQLIHGPKGIGERMARHIEHELALAEYSLDQGVVRPGSDEQFPGTPVVGTAQLGDDGYWMELEHPVGSGEGFIRYPARDPNTYALRVKGDSMRPRIKPGEFVVIEPNHAVVVGEEVMVQTVDGRSMIKELASRKNGMVELRSINSDHRVITLDDHQISKMHHVGGILKASLYYEKSY